jgi:hypothetical protein
MVLGIVLVTAVSVLLNRLLGVPVKLWAAASQRATDTTAGDDLSDVL